jgi:cytosine deaminase
MDLVIRNARMRGREVLLDIGVRGHSIEAVETRLAATCPREVDAAGRLVSPGFVNLHTHADKALLGEVMRPGAGGGTAGGDRGAGGTGR